MPQLGPAFLYRPLPSFSTLRWDRAWRWFIDGLSVIAPTALREFGWRPVMRLERARRDVEGSLATGADAVIERSLLGAQRLAPSTPASRRLPSAIELPRSDIFETSVSLPAAARGTIAETISHRLDVLSPLPVEAIRHAIGAPSASVDDRFDAPVAIARKSTLDQIVNAEGGGSVALIGACPDEGGRFTYVFFERAEVASAGRAAPRRILALVVSIILLLTGLSVHLDRRLSAIGRYQASLSESLRAEKVAARFLSELPPTPIAGVGGKDIAPILDRVATALPERLWIEELELSSAGAAVRGYSPVDAAWPEATTPALSPSDRPGAERFSLSIPQAAQP